MMRFKEKRLEMDRKEKAVAMHQRTYNCAQSTALAFCDVYKGDPQTVFQAMEPFGFGMGCQSVCGALTGCLAAIGLVTSDGNLETPGTKQLCYELADRARAMFAERAGSDLCSVLKASDDGSIPFYCDRYIRIGVEVAEEILGLRDAE